MYPCLHPCIIISSVSFVFARILASSHSYILRFIRVSLYPRVLAYSYPHVHVCFLVYLHPLILISSGLCVLPSMLTSSWSMCSRYKYVISASQNPSNRTVFCFGLLPQEQSLRADLKVF